MEDRIFSVLIAGKIKSEYSPDGMIIRSLGFQDKSERINGMKSLDFGLNIGTGIEMDDIMIRIQYGYGLNKLEPKVSNQNNLQNRVISISIGCMFGRE